MSSMKIKTTLGEAARAGKEANSSSGSTKRIDPLLYTGGAGLIQAENLTFPDKIGHLGGLAAEAGPWVDTHGSVPRGRQPLSLLLCGMGARVWTLALPEVIEGQRVEGFQTAVTVCSRLTLLTGSAKRPNIKDVINHNTKGVRLARRGLAICLQLG